VRINQITIALAPEGVSIFHSAIKHVYRWFILILTRQDISYVLHYFWGLAVPWDPNKISDVSSDFRLHFYKDDFAVFNFF